MDSGNRRRPGLKRSRWPAWLAWVAGTALQLTQPALWPPTVYGLIVVASLAALFAVWLRPRADAGICAATIVLVSVIALAFAQVGWRAAAFQAQGLLPELEGRDLLVTGIVTAMPQRQSDGLRLQMGVTSALADGVPVRLPPRIQLGWYQAFGGNRGEPQADAALPEVWAGERWRMLVRLKAPHGNSNPHGFDYELWLWQNGVQATGHVRQGANRPEPRQLEQTGRHPVEWLRQATRQRIDARLASSPQAGWISALVTGDQNAIDQADWDVFRATGVAHLMSISGLHITMFAWVAAALVGIAWRRSARLCLRLPAPHAAVLGGLTLAFAYALFSGWGVPSQRTIGMLALVTLLRLSGRSWPWPMVWLLVGAAVLTFDPWAMLQAGFWLSFVAVGILFASGETNAGPGRWSWRSALRAMLREQAIITLALTPLVVVLFGQVSLVGFVANLFAIPWVTLLVTPLAMAGTIVPAAWDLAAIAIRLLAVVLNGLAQLAFATVSVASAPSWMGMAAVMGGLLLAVRLPLALRLCGATLVLPVLLWQSPRPTPGQFDLLAADVGQGTAVLVRTAHHALLYDAGPRYSRDSDAGHRVLLPLMRALGVTPDLLVLSHRDSDHVGGAAAVLSMAPDAGLLSSLEPAHVLRSLRPGRRCEAGQSWSWDGVEFTVMHPQARDYDTPNKPNRLSCVLRIRAAPRLGQSAGVALLTGDIEAAQERRLVSDGATLRADLLLVPHHGSTTSSSDVFLDAVAPRQGLVQSGYRNRFGHPAAAPMARYAERGISVLDSPHCGAMAWHSTEPGAVLCHRSTHRRYWQHAL